KDCAKSTRTAADGRFEITGLDRSLKFTVLASAPGRKTHLTGLMDPQAGPIKCVLEPIPAGLPPERCVNVLIVDDGGHTIAGALLSPYGAETAERRWWGRVDGVDPMVSDPDGRACLDVPDGFKAIDVEVTVPGYAGALALQLRPGAE